MRRTYNKQLGIYEELGKKGDQPVPSSGGQSGDTQGLSAIASATSESVKELVEDGNYDEAALVDAIENMPDEDEAGLIHTDTPPGDKPAEYLEGETPTSEELEQDIEDQEELDKDDLEHPRGGNSK